MRLIDADALAMAIVDAGQASKRYKIGDIWELRYTEIKEVMDEQPTVDAVPVVRCKDCAHYRPNMDSETGQCAISELYYHFLRPTDYCSRAERKEE